VNGHYFLDYELRRFPNYLTCFENLWDATALTNSQVNLLSAQAEHMVHAAADLFKRALGP